MNAQSIISSIDVILAVGSVLAILYSIVAPLVREPELRADKANFLKGWAYGFSRATLKPWIRMFGTEVEQVVMAVVTFALFAALYYVGAYWLLAVQLTSPLLALLLKKVPQPKWSLMDKLTVDRKINLG